jgi:hypothetical protein
VLKFSWLSLLLAGLAQAALAAGYGFDTITPPAVYAAQLQAAGMDRSLGAWTRVRGVVDPGQSAVAGDGRTVETDRAGLRALHGLGIKTMVLLRWERASWRGGVREGGGQRMPLDLREAYERGRRLGETYGDLVDGWEIDNEPDISFVADNPETYAAFLKAMYLGLHAGAVQGEGRAARGEGPEETMSLDPSAGSYELTAHRSDWLAQKRGFPSLNPNLSSSTGGAMPMPRVVMAPLALPPGPYLERLWANGLASYTDGFNFHYYGYAEDFTGVYEQFRDSVAKLGGEGRGAAVAPTGRRGWVGDRKPDQRPGLHVAGRPAERSAYQGSVADYRLSPPAFRLGQRKALPVFITEYGYGLLDAEAAGRVGGRVRQWRWFSSVIKQVHALRIEGPMAFLWNAYFEAGLNEFGLMAVAPMGLAEGAGASKSSVEVSRVEGAKQGAGSDEPGAKGYELRSGEGGAESGTRVEGPEAGDRGIKPFLQFAPADFGEACAQPWMQFIGKPVGKEYASPAVAYLWDYAGRHPYRSKNWEVDAEAPSVVLVDFMPAGDLVQLKRSGGYMLTAEGVSGSGAESSGQGSSRGHGGFVFYNFAEHAVVGRVVWGGEGVRVTGLPERVVLAPGERREVPVELEVQAGAFDARTLRVEVIPDAGSEESRAVFATRLFPASKKMTSRLVAGFDFSAKENAVRREALLKRPLADGEPALKPDGRWLVTDGVRVREGEDVWRFQIDYLPAEPLRPAMAELPFPEGFVFSPGTRLWFQQRRLPVVESCAGGGVSVGVDTARLKARAGEAEGNMLDVYFRTENGNFYQTWPRQGSGAEWKSYSGGAEDFTMGFFGRAKLPWRFSDNRPASLVFFFRPSLLPAIFEVRGGRIIRLESPGR